MADYNILICDDNPSIFKSLNEYFKGNGFQAYWAENGEKALELVSSYNISLIILDIMLPGMSGIEACTKIREFSDVPIIMLSAKGETTDRIIGLEVGADDYVTKPFSPREVYIRATKLLKRINPEPQKIYTLNVGELTIYPDSYEVFVSGERVLLAAKEFEVLRYLASNAGRVMSREHIINAVWGIDYLGESRIVDAIIKRIRHKLFIKDDLDFTISTIFGVGYKLEVLK